MKININKKFMIFGIFVLFIGAAVIPGITGNVKKTTIKSMEESFFGYPLNDDFTNSFWKLDECSGNTIGDSSVHNYGGTKNGATWTTNGYDGCALEFDGIDDYVDFSDHAAEIMFNKTDDIILSFYFKSTGEGLIFSATAPWGNNPEFRIELLSNGSILFYKITQLCGIILYSNGTYDDGDWHHVKYYYNGITSNPTVILYVDDTFDTTFTHWLCEIENDDYSKTMMGMHAHSSTNHFDGTIDEFKIIKYEGGNKQSPPTVTGPHGGEPNEEHCYTFITNDPEGDDVYIMIDWGDGEITDWLGPYESGEPVVLCHTWDEEGAYCIRTKSKDMWDDSSWSDCFEVKIGNQPPDPPVIEGPTCGESGEELTYTFVSDDFESHDIYYYVDWGDGTTEDWFGPFSSGEEASASHTWDSDGGYDIKAKAKDIYDSESDWSEPFSILIGENSPPGAPEIDGPKKGQIGTGYGYIFVSTDPDQNRVIYEIDWGDGKSDEEGPNLSGEEVVVNHAWESPGTFIIKARARDEFCGAYSDWSEYKVNIPRSRYIKFNLIKWLFELFPNSFKIIKNILSL